MPRTVIKLDSRIFDKTARSQDMSNAVSRAIKRFARYVPEQQEKSKPSGKTYKRRGGTSFRRSHRASTKGQRPAIDSGQLHGSTRAVKTGNFTGEVTTVAKSKGFDYAAQQEKIGRHIQNKPEDTKMAEKMLAEEGEKVIR